MRLFRSLGNRPDKIARVMEREDCKGIPGTICCPVTRWLEKRPGVDCAIVRINETSCYEVVMFRNDYADVDRFELDGAMAEFATRFDAGAYPYLRS